MINAAPCKIWHQVDSSKVDSSQVSSTRSVGPGVDSTLVQHRSIYQKQYISAINNWHYKALLGAHTDGVVLSGFVRRGRMKLQSEVYTIEYYATANNKLFTGCLLGDF